MESIGDLAISWRIKGSSSFLFSQAKSFGLSCLYHRSIAPPCGNMYSTYLYWKLLAPLHVLVLYLTYVYICCASYLLNLRNQAYSCVFAFHVCVLCWAYVASCLYLSGSFERLMDYPILGECDVLWAAHNPNNVCIWEIPLRIDIARLSSLYVVCHSHEKFKF